VSSLAQYYLGKGHTVSGSDLAASEITEMLAKKGTTILIGNSPDHITQDIAFNRNLVPITRRN
jgi:UDP-N-acetylmuramate-alanine ligase